MRVESRGEVFGGRNGVLSFGVRDGVLGWPKYALMCAQFELMFRWELLSQLGLDELD